MSARNETTVKYENGVYYASLHNTTFRKYDGTKLVNDPSMPKCTLQKVSYSKKMYEANTLDIEILAVIGETDVDTAVTSFENVFKGATISVKENVKPLTETSDVKDTMIDYRICAVVPREDTSATQDKNRSITIILKVFSPDKALDITPYCETFYGKTLEEILTSKFGKDGMFKAFNGKYNYKPKNLKDTNDAEYKQPYLVQYNEPFFQFLVRVANRCGQYVYYEHGQLNIGVFEDTKTKKDYSKKKVNSDSKPNPNYMGDAVIERHVDYDYADSLNESSFFASSYCKSNQDNATEYSENNEIVDNSQSCYIKKSDNYTAEKDVITPGIGWLSAVGAFTKGDSLVSVVNDSAKKGVEVVALRSAINSDLTEDFEKKEGPAYEHNKTLPIPSGKETPDKDDQPVTGPLTSEWYEEIAKNQRNAEKKKLTIRYKTHPNVFMLGDTLDDKYTITEISGEWSYVKKTVDNNGIVHDETIVSYNHEVTAIGKDGTPYLAEKRIRRATPHKAIVAQVNDPLRIGRVKVKFPWDKSETLSPWIRVNSPAAYENGGFLFTPAKGDEAMVDFEDGNIERPFVTGFMHTRTKKPYIGSRTYNKNAGMYKTLSMNEKGKYVPNDPMSCVITNRTGQSITLENGKNARGFFKNFIPASGILNNCGLGAMNSEDKSLGGSITLTDAYGVCTIKSDTGARSITIDSAMGKVELSAFTGITVSCPNGDIKLKGKNITLEAGNNINIKSGGNKGGLGYNTTVASLANTVLTDVGTIVDAVTAYKWGSGVKGLVDISYYRAFLECLLRPLEGTTSIQTPGYIMLSTGTGKGINDALKANHKDKEFKRTDLWGWLKVGKTIHKQYEDNYKGDENKGAAALLGGVEGAVNALTSYLGVDSIAGFGTGPVETLHNCKQWFDSQTGNSSGLFYSPDAKTFNSLGGERIASNYQIAGVGGNSSKIENDVEENNMLLSGSNENLNNEIMDGIPDVENDEEINEKVKKSHQKMFQLWRKKNK